MTSWFRAQPPFGVGLKQHAFRAVDSFKLGAFGSAGKSKISTQILTVNCNAKTCKKTIATRLELAMHGTSSFDKLVSWTTTIGMALG